MSILFFIYKNLNFCIVIGMNKKDNILKRGHKSLI